METTMFPFGPGMNSSEHFFRRRQNYFHGLILGYERKVFPGGTDPLQADVLIFQNAEHGGKSRRNGHAQQIQGCSPRQSFNQIGQQSLHFYGRRPQFSQQFRDFYADPGGISADPHQMAVKIRIKSQEAILRGKMSGNGSRQRNQGFKIVFNRVPADRLGIGIQNQDNAFHG